MPLSMSPQFSPSLSSSRATISSRHRVAQRVHHRGQVDVLGRRVERLTLLDSFWTSVSGIVHGLALARAEGIAGAQLPPCAAGVFGLLPEMLTRFARQLDDGGHPGDRSTIASAAAGIEHILQTTRAHQLDAGVSTASRAVLHRAVDAGHGADGLPRLAQVLAEPAPVASGVSRPAGVRRRG
jgi:hypothetical protein